MYGSESKSEFPGSEGIQAERYWDWWYKANPIPEESGLEDISVRLFYSWRLRKGMGRCPEETLNFLVHFGVTLVGDFMIAIYHKVKYRAGTKTYKS